jgi:hypothetical protein
LIILVHQAEMHLSSVLVFLAELLCFGLGQVVIIPSNIGDMNVGIPVDALPYKPKISPEAFQHTKGVGVRT